jgi:Na+/pantothenate symporter
MLLASVFVACASLISGDGAWWAAGFGIASLVFMQVGYFGAVVALSFAEKSRRR